MAAAYAVTVPIAGPPEAAGADCPAPAAASASVVLVSIAPAWLSSPGRHIGKIPGCTLILSPGGIRNVPQGVPASPETISHYLRDGGHGAAPATDGAAASRRMPAGFLRSGS